MKTIVLSGLVCAGLSFLGSRSAEAALIYDAFNYTAGTDLTGQSPNGGTTIWNVTGTNGAGGTDAITIASGSLTVPGLAPSSGNSITYGGLGLTNRISVGGIINTGTVYYSFAFQITDLGGLTTNGGFMAGFNNSTGDQAAQPTQIGARLVTKASGTGFQAGLDKTSGQVGSFLFADEVFELGDTIFVVASYTFNSGSSSDDEARMWINPDPSTFGLANPPSTNLISTTGTDLGGATTQQLASFLFRQGNASAVPGAVIADELRVDTTWAGVTPVPEPSSVLLLSLVGGSALLMRRRKLRG